MKERIINEVESLTHEEKQRALKKKKNLLLKKWIPQSVSCPNSQKFKPSDQQGKPEVINRFVEPLGFGEIFSNE